MSGDMEGTQCHPSIWLLKVPVNLCESHYTDLVYLNMYMVHMISEVRLLIRQMRTHTQKYTTKISLSSQLANHFTFHVIWHFSSLAPP